jgi:hypothetical protein
VPRYAKRAQLQLHPLVIGFLAIHRDCEPHASIAAPEFSRCPAPAWQGAWRAAVAFVMLLAAIAKVEARQDR